MLKRERGLDADAIAKLADGSQYAPRPLTDDERARLGAATLDGCAAACRRRLSGMARSASSRVFGDERAEEGAALSSRAPLDLRVNTLKAEIATRLLACLPDLAPEPTRWSPWGLRIRLSADAKSPAIHAEPAFIKGMIEVQDEGSQLAALFPAPSPASRWSISAPAPAARPWRWRR